MATADYVIWLFLQSFKTIEHHHLINVFQAFYQSEILLTRSQRCCCFLEGGRDSDRNQLTDVLKTAAAAAATATTSAGTTAIAVAPLVAADMVEAVADVAAGMVEAVAEVTA